MVAGITYSDETPPEPKDLAEAISPLVRDLKCADHGTQPRDRRECRMMLTKVLYAKDGEAKRFLIVDAAMNDLIVPVSMMPITIFVPCTRRLRKGRRKPLMSSAPYANRATFGKG